MTKRQQYDREFKLSAVRLLRESDLSLAQVARKLGIHESMLRRWRKQVQAKGKRAFGQSGRYEDTEVTRLRRQNRRLKQDLEMLKKTLGLLERLQK